MKRSRKLLVRAALVVVGVAVLGSISYAATRPDDRAGMLGANVAQVASPAASHPDNRAGIRGTGENLITPAAAHPDNRAGVRGVGEIVDETGGTDWRSIGIGVAAGAAALLIVGGAIATARHGGHRPHRPIPTH